MTIDYRTRNIVIAAALAAAAVLLTVLYVSSARKHDKTQAQSVTVYVSTTELPARHGRHEDRRQPQDRDGLRASAMTPDAVTSPEQIQNLYTTEPIYAGEQLTLKRFAPPAASRASARSSRGNQRAMQISGDTNQLLAGTLVPGDRVDVVANLKDPKDQNDVQSFVALRGLLVLQTDKGQGGAKIDRSTIDDHAVILAVTDEQAQRLTTRRRTPARTGRSQLRPVKKPKDSAPSTATFTTVVNGGAK